MHSVRTNIVLCVNSVAIRRILCIPTICIAWQMQKYLFRRGRLFRVGALKLRVAFVPVLKS